MGFGRSLTAASDTSAVSSSSGAKTYVLLFIRRIARTPMVQVSRSGLPYNLETAFNRISFGTFAKKRIGRSSDNRALRNRAARLTSKSDVMRACGRWSFPFLRNGDYLTPAFTDSPPCARFARRLAQLARLTSLRPPLGAGALFRNAVELRIRHFLGDGKRN